MPKILLLLLLFFECEIFVDRTTFHFHSFNKINDFVITQYANTIFYPFYLSLDQMKMRWIRDNSVDKQKLLTEKIFGR